VPAGVSGAVLLVPVQLSLLSVPVAAVTSTNLVYNVVAAPGALLGFRGRGTLLGPLTRRLLAGTLPGVLVGVAVRAILLDRREAFLIVVAAVLVPTGLSLVTGARRPRRREHREPPAALLVTVAFAVGVVGGVYGIGGGSLLAPVLLWFGYSAYAVAPACLAATFATSVAGVAAFQLLAAADSSLAGAAPNYPVGIALGLGGLAGSFIGARLQHRLPERALQTMLGLVLIGAACAYLVEAAA
jgi:uncharacterized membrane protein YfcA